jgi:hypothetical protein
MSADLTADRLREVLSYDAYTGEFRWLVAFGRVRVGDVAGSIGKDGYRHIGIDGRCYLAHRLAYLYVYGTWPSRGLDHITNDCRADKSDNRISNLRPANQSQNLVNRGLDSNNSSGAKGVCWHKSASKWQAEIGHNGK